LKKLNEVVDYVIENKADHWIDGGDLFEDWDQFGLRPTVYEALGRVRKNSHCLMTFVVGNHPNNRANGSLFSYWTDGLINMRGAGIHQIVVHPRVCIFTEHANIITDSHPGLPWRHKRIFEVKRDIKLNYAAKSGDIFLMSHYHPPQGHIISDGIHFISPGSMARITTEEAGVKRTPQFVEITIDDVDDSTRIKFIDVKSAPENYQ
jgi:DNA repair exonuclease SbcCD nuclease subunit